MLQPWQHSTWRWGKEFEADLHVTGDEFDWLEVDIGPHRHNIEFTQTQSGSGRRRWFSCPDCRRACRIVYFFFSRFACRLCLGLRYESQLEKPEFRTLRRADRIYGKAGGRFPHELDPAFPPKPKWMRWEKYRDLEDRHSAAQGACLGPGRGGVGRVKRVPWGQAAAALGIV